MKLASLVTFTLLVGSIAAWAADPAAPEVSPSTEKPAAIKGVMVSRDKVPTSPATEPAQATTVKSSKSNSSDRTRRAAATAIDGGKPKAATEGTDSSPAAVNGAATQKSPVSGNPHVAQ